MKKIVFLDRDGTLNKEVGYLHKKEDFEFIEHAEKAIKLLNENGYMIVVVTNQAGIAKGIYEEKDVLTIHEYIQKELKKSDAWIDEFCYCPYHKDGIIKKYKKDSIYRKPEIGFFEKIGNKVGIDKSKSWMIGDAESDIQAGINYGIKTILVSTGYGRYTYKTATCKFNYYVKDIYAAAKLILSEKRD